MSYNSFVLVTKCNIIILRHNVFASYDVLIGNGRTYSNFYIFIPIFLHCVLQTLIEVAFVERIKTQYRSNYVKARKWG